jgi:hypothetical protein
MPVGLGRASENSRSARSARHGIMRRCFGGAMPKGFDPRWGAGKTARVWGQGCLGPLGRTRQARIGICKVRCKLCVIWGGQNG